MSSNTKLVAFILGAGSHIGAALASKLRENGYKVALGSRNPEANSEGDPYFNVKVDVQKQETIEAAFDTVAEKLGPVNVVIFNAASLNVPPDDKDFFSLPTEAYRDSVAVGLGAFTAAQKALAGFRDALHKENPKTFVVTGNVLPFNQYSPPAYYTLGAQKALQTRFIATAAKHYESENIQFYFATLVSEKGEIPGPGVFKGSAQTHADVYWQLINNKKQGDWNYQFTVDGKAYGHA